MSGTQDHLNRIQISIIKFCAWSDDSLASMTFIPPHQEFVTRLVSFLTLRK